MQPLHVPKVRVYNHSLHIYTEHTVGVRWSQLVMDITFRSDGDFGPSPTAGNVLANHRTALKARGSLQPWSQGVIAVVVFLVLVAICFVVNRFWCKKQQDNVETVVSIGAKEEAVVPNGREGTYVISAVDVRSKENQHAYENTLDPEEKVITTAM
uniref:PDZK1 interacting protein 1 n=1 Tax=Gallus gallus TaxID=9031 RepID=A0A8V0ZQN9_CHICK